MLLVEAFIIFISLFVCFLGINVLIKRSRIKIKRILKQVSIAYHEQPGRHRTEINDRDKVVV